MRLILVLAALYGVQNMTPAQVAEVRASIHQLERQARDAVVIHAVQPVTAPQEAAAQPQQQHAQPARKPGGMVVTGGNDDVQNRDMANPVPHLSRSESQPRQQVAQANANANAAPACNRTPDQFGNLNYCF